MYRLFGKRLLDILMSLFLLALFSWLFLLIPILYFAIGYKDVFFVQSRIGLDEVPFRLYKFRTLKENASAALQERRFWFGDFLRFTSLDELPQLIAVLTGRMSLVGPRPLPMEYLPLFSASQHARHNVKPGITGWAQVNGRNSISWKKKFELDNYYVRNLSFWLDLKIMILTVKILLSFKKDVSLTEEKFKGA